ncbi:plasmid maintenance protein CcdB [Sphingomonas sp. HMWF008]|nr:plasmid maintenance protein CcdB [Sphingomonas sp. HMWF008]
MARFDVYRHPDGRGYLLDCQTDFLAGLDTRLTVPLFLLEDYPHPAARLNPVFLVEDVRVVMMTQYTAAIEKRRLGGAVGRLADEQDAIMNALDMLLSGY